MEDQLTVIDRATEFEGQREAARIIDVVLERVKGGASARPLRLVHRRVPAPKQRFRVLSMPRKEDDANARSDFQLFALDRQRLEQSLKQPSGRQCGGCLVRPPGEDGGETVPAPSGERGRI